MLLEVKNVVKSYPTTDGSLFARRKKRIINNVSFSLDRGNCVGLIGESGSGKSTLSRLIGGLERADSGDILLDGKPVNRDSARRGKISAVFQDYTSSINPAMTVAKALAEPLLLNGFLSRVQLNERISELLNLTGLSPTLSGRYPHELSGGQIQRVCIARAIATNPALIILDEAVSSLDITSQVAILDLLADLKQRFNLAYLFITHDIQAVTYLCDRVLFFLDGEIIESCPVMELAQVQHPYSQKLLNSVISL